MLVSKLRPLATGTFLLRNESTQVREPRTETRIHTASAVEHSGSGDAQLEQDIRHRSPSTCSKAAASPYPVSTTSEAQDRAYRSHVPEQSPFRRLESKLNEMSREELSAASKLDMDLASSGPAVEVPDQIRLQRMNAQNQEHDMIFQAKFAAAKQTHLKVIAMASRKADLATQAKAAPEQQTQLKSMASDRSCPP
jgi:hypothetical protein